MPKFIFNTKYISKLKLEDLFANAEMKTVIKRKCDFFSCGS